MAIGSNSRLQQIEKELSGIYQRRETVAARKMRGEVFGSQSPQIFRELRSVWLLRARSVYHAIAEECQSSMMNLSRIDYESHRRYDHEHDEKRSFSEQYLWS